MNTGYIIADQSLPFFDTASRRPGQRLSQAAVYTSLRLAGDRLRRLRVAYPRAEVYLVEVAEQPFSTPRAIRIISQVSSTETFR